MVVPASASSWAMPWMDSPMRCAARPVGAMRAMRSGSKPRARSVRRKARTMVVLPVPGPPVTTAKRCVTTVWTAANCSVLRNLSSPIFRAASNSAAESDSPN